MNWNNEFPGGFAPPGGGTPGFPSPSGYNPVYGTPPAGPPGQSTRDLGYPGAQHHHQHPNFNSPMGPPPGQGGYGPPPGAPPGSWAPPPGPPPGNWGPPPGPPPGNWGPPPGPPPSGAWGPPSGPPPGQGGWGTPGPYGGPGQFAPPPGPPPPPPPSGHQQYGPQFDGQNGQAQQPFFEYSQCNGRRKALCIGINYRGQDAELKGCINDANNVNNFLCSRYGYKQEDVVMLTDDATNARQVPTKENIMAAMQWLVNDARPNDALFFHYSGHGGQTKDLDGDEDGAFDEVIYPVDFQENGHIVDDDMHAIMVRPLPPGCRLTAIFDSCHSGSALDLPYIYSHEGKIKEPNLAAEAGAGLLSAATSYARGDSMGALKSAMSIFKSATGGQKKANEYAKQTRTSPADVISFSGCKDSQTSADTVEAGQATGAMSFAFITALSQQSEQSFQSLLVTLRGILKSKYSQKPQLSASHPIDTNLRFIA